MKFEREVGGILSPQKDLLWVGEGSPARVDFPTELMWKLHKSQPGSVHILAHTHPDGMTGLSHEDETTLKAWAFALSPFPARMIVLTKAKTKEEYKIITYLGILEPLELWKERKKETRDFKIVNEKSEQIGRSVYKSGTWIDDSLMPPWGKILIDLSYKE